MRRPDCIYDMVKPPDIDRFISFRIYINFPYIGAAFVGICGYIFEGWLKTDVKSSANQTLSKLTDSNLAVCEPLNPYDLYFCRFWVPLNWYGSPTK